MHAQTHQQSKQPFLPKRASAHHPAQSVQVTNIIARHPLQAKLKVGAPNDRFEQEADRVADRVMRMPNPAARSSVDTTSSAVTIQRKCSACEDDALQRKPDSSHRDTPSSGLDSVASTLRQGGRPLDAGTRNYFEPRFGADFSNVRIHTDTNAAASARSVNALAYTVGRDVVFNSGQYAPHRDAGKRLLAHELTHVMQQGDYPGSIQRLVGPCVDVVTPHRLLVRDSVHSAVREAQRKLNLFHASEVAAGRPGLADAPLVEDCIFGQHTFNAVLSFQQIKFPGMLSEHDGKIGDHTWAQLDMVGIAPPPIVVPPVVVPPVVVPPVVVPPSCLTPTNPDQSGSAFNPTTDGETMVCISNPVDCNDAFDCRDVAFAAATASGLSGPHLGPQDAFRHCVWNCCMAQRMGAFEAEKFGTAHENSSPSPIPFDNQMDLHDNSVGRTLGTPGANCVTECMAAATSGRLRTIRRPPLVPTDCIGASDQPWP